MDFPFSFMGKRKRYIEWARQNRPTKWIRTHTKQLNSAINANTIDVMNNKTIPICMVWIICYTRSLKLQNTDTHFLWLWQFFLKWLAWMRLYAVVCTLAIVVRWIVVRIALTSTSNCRLSTATHVIKYSIIFPNQSVSRSWKLTLWSLSLIEDCVLPSN